MPSNHHRTPRLFSLLAALVFASLPGIAAADESDDLVARGLAAEESGDTAAALGLFRRAHEQRPDDALINHKIAKQLFDATLACDDDAEVRALATEALAFAGRSIKLDPESAEYVLSRAVLHGVLGLYGDRRTKVEYARRIKRDAERALELDPDYAWAHLVLGRWHVEVHKLGFAKRLAVTLFYGGLPKGSLKKGIEHLERAVEIEPEFIAHRVELGFAYAASGRTARAIECWRTALAGSGSGLYDEGARLRARHGLRKFAPRQDTAES